MPRCGGTRNGASSRGIGGPTVGGMFRFPRATGRRRPDPAAGSMLAGAMAGGIRDIYGHTITYVAADLDYV